MPPKGYKKAKAPTLAAPTVNAKGEISSWNGQSADSRLLKMLVEREMIQGLKAAAVREAHPVFKKYSYGCFSSALGRYRESYNLSVTNRKGNMGSGQLMGMHQCNNLNTVSEEDEEADEDYDFEDGISCLSVQDGGVDDDDGYTFETHSNYDGMSGFNSQVGGGGGRYNLRGRGQRGDGAGAETIVGSVVSSASAAVARSSGRKLRVVHAPAKVTSDFMTDVWTDSKTNTRCSIQYPALTGDNAHKELQFRVDTEQKHLVVTHPLSNFLTSPEKAFYSYLGSETDDFKGASGKYEHHPKIIARNISIAKVKKRNESKLLTMEQRVPLPFPCCHRFVSAAEDPIFYGSRVIGYPNGEKHFHIELMKDTKDAYEPNKDDHTVYHAKHYPGSVHRSPMEVEIPWLGPLEEQEEQQEAQLRQQQQAQQQAGEVAARQAAHQAAQQQQAREHGAAVLNQANLQAPTRQATVLKGGYEGAASRGGRSVKSAKRTAAAQDNQDDDSGIESMTPKSPKGSVHSLNSLTGL